MRNEDIKKLERILDLLGENDSAEQKDRFFRYWELLQQWNQRKNLISRRDIDYVVDYHFAESLAVFAAFSVPEKGKMLDVGSGGGFPGIPIAILRPGLEIFLNESKRMKALFLKEAAEKLDLINAQVVMDRCENLKEDEVFRGKFDFVVTRAVGKLAEVFEWVSPLLKKGGLFIAWKGGDVTREIEDLKRKYTFEMIDVKEMDSRFVDPQRKRCFVYLKA